MRHNLLTVYAIATIACCSLYAGTLSGTVKARGNEQADDTGKGDKYESRKYRFAETVDYDEFQDFVVYINDPALRRDEDVPETAEVIMQNGASFEPHVMPIMVGTTVRWPNRDSIFHNVFSYSEPKPFDLGMYKGDHGEDGKLKELLFDKTGRVDVFCSIHKDMHCVVLILPNTYFAKTDKHGRFEIPNIPAGTYELKVWHERMPELTQSVEITDDGKVELDLVMGLKELPKY